MDKELKIKVTSDGDVLKKLSKDLKDAKNEFLLLKQSGTASGQAMKDAGDKITKLGNQLRATKKEVNDLANSQKMSKFQLLEFGENLTVVTAGLLAGTAAIRNFAKESIQAGADLTVLKSNFKGTKEDLELFGKATTGNLGEGALIKLSNRATALGYAMKDQALLFDLAENAADAYGGSIEENFDRVVDAITKGGRGLEALGVSTKLFKDEADKLSQSLLGLAYKDLDAAQRQMIGFKTIIALTGGELSKVNDKLPDDGDNIANLSRAWDTYKEKLGETIIKQVYLNDKTADFSKISGEAGQNTGDFLSALVSIGKFIQPTADAFNPLLQTYRVFNFLIRESIGLLNLQQKAQKGTVNIPSLDERVKAATDKIMGATIPDINIDSSQKEDIAKGGNPNARSDAKDKEVVITNELIDKKKELADALLKEATFVDKTTLAYANYLQQIAQLKNELAGLNLPMSTLTVNGVVQTMPGGVRDAGINPIPVDPKAKEQSTLLEDSNTIYSNISSAIGVLGVGTETFVGTLMSGFNTVLTIMEAIKSVNTILSFIPGFASGGSFAGGSPIMVGERGPEIIFPNTSGYVMNNFNSMQVMKSQQQPIYINANLNALDFYTTGRKAFNSLQSFKRIN